MTEPPLPPPDGETELPPAPAWVSDALGSLRADDPPIPETVARSLDAVLASLAAERAATGTGSKGTGTTGTGAPPLADAAEQISAQQIPAQRVVSLDARRRSGARNPLGWVGGLAAAALVVVGGVALAHNTGTSSSSSATAFGDGGQPTTNVAYVSSGTSYAAPTLTTQVRSVLTRAGVASAMRMPTVAASHLSSESTAPPATPSGDSTAPTGEPTATDAPTPSATSLSAAPTEQATGGAATMPPLPKAVTTPGPACLDALATTPDQEPVLVDDATYAGTKAYIVVFSATSSASWNIWVVATDCSSADSHVLSHLTLTR